MTTFDEPRALPLASVSGAQLRSVPPFVAAQLLERVVGNVDTSFKSGEAWGAFEDHTELIATCAVAPASKEAYRVLVAVVPERRRLGIGGELLHVAMTECARRGVQMLIGSHPAGAIDAQALVASLDATCAQQLQHDQVEIVVFIAKSAPVVREGTE